MANTEVNWSGHDWQTGPHSWTYKDDHGIWRCGGCAISALMFIYQSQASQETTRRHQEPPAETTLIVMKPSQSASLDTG